MRVLETAKATQVTPSFLQERVRGDLLCYSHPIAQPHLRQSIRDFGMIHPIIVREGYDQEPAIVICGHRRLAVARDLPPATTLPMITVSRRVMSLKEALFLSISENQSTRTLNLIEKSNIISICAALLKMAEGDVIREVMPLLQLQPSKNQMLDVLKLRSLPAAVADYVVAENIPLKVAKRLAQISPDAMEILFPLATGLKMGQNRLDEILNHLDILTHREDKPLGDLLEEILTIPGISTLLTAREIESPKKLEALRAHIRKRAFPTISAMEETFSRNSKSLQLPHNILLTPPNYFEGDRMDVRLTFKNKEELKSAAEKLLESAKSDAIKNILSLL